MVRHATSIAPVPAAAPGPAAARGPAVRDAADAGDQVPPLYRALRGLARPLMRALFDLSVTGAEWLPASGPFIVAANHHNYLDGVVLGVAVPRPIAFVVMPGVWHASPLHPALHRRIGSVPVNLARPDPAAIRRVLRALEQGRGVGIFPEGPFSREGRLVGGRPGAALLALRSGAPLVPAAIRGTFEALHGRRLHIPRRRPLSVRFGAPMRFGPPRDRPIGRDERDEVTRRIMREIAGLLDGRPGAAPARADGS
jgi:1-acyl-sn-glycerol-3-phosphate acyltransferase